MQVRLLGPVDVLIDGTPHAVPGLRRKAVLAALALQHGRIVSADLLVHAVWGDTPPATAGNTLQSHVSYLRKVLGGPSAIVARPPGYLLNVAGEPATDVRAAQLLIDRAGQADDPRQGAECLRSAVDLWRGRPLADVAELAWFADHARSLDRLLLQAQRALADLRLALGQHAELVPELETLAHQHPLDEHLHRLLMLALYRAGRQTDALTTYEVLRRTLDEELGVRPGPALHDLHIAILRHDRSLEPASAGAASTTPAQLPPALASFVGRGDAIARLDFLLAARPAAVVVSAVSGTAGVGKTTLALHWAHRVRAEFPDGQLYVNLQGFAPGGHAIDPAEALRGFLDAFGVPRARVPIGLQAQTGLYRSLLAGRRMLIVLDNALDADQVRPLLPGTPGSLAVITSRNRLTSLVAVEGAHLVTLELLTPAEAHDLLSSRLGDDRVSAEPAAVAEIIARCAGLPLALAVVAARAAAEPRARLADLAADLRETGRRLDTLDAGDPTTQVRAVFSWSYAALGEDAARLFRLLGLHPGPDAGLPAVASLAGVSLTRARALLAELSRGHLLTEAAPGRYAFHDLLRAYATELVTTCDSPDTRHAARHRMLDHYLCTANTADSLLNRKLSPITLAAIQPGVVPETLSRHEDALAWFAAECPVLLAVIAQATAGFETHTWQLASTFTTFLDRQGRWPALVRAQLSALDAAHRHDDRAGQATVHRCLGIAYAMLERPDEARSHFGLALDLFGDLGNHLGLARTHQALGWLTGNQGRNHDALDHARHALDHYRAAGDRGGQSSALNNLGWLHSQLGENDQALTDCRGAFTLAVQAGDLYSQAHICDSLGHAHHQLGQYDDAITCYQRALGLFSRTGDQHSKAACLRYLGDTHRDAGDGAAASEAWTQALNIADRLALPDTDPLRVTLLERLGRPENRRADPDR